MSKGIPWSSSVICCLALAGCGASGGSSGGSAAPGDPAPAPPPLPLGTTTGSMTVQGYLRTYIVHVPAVGMAPRPLVLVLHGGTGTGAAAERDYGFDTLSDSEGFVVAYPDGLDFGGGRDWADGRGATEPDVAGVDDVGFLRALAAKLSQQTGIDPLRIYATGISNGAMMSQRLGCEAADLVAAIGPVAGSLPQPLVASFHPPSPVSVIEFHGTLDQFVPYDGGAMTRGDGGAVLGVEDTVADWAAVDGMTTVQDTTLLPDVEPDDGCRVTRWRYVGGAAGTEVDFYRIIGGGHTWPDVARSGFGGLTGNVCDDIDATSLIWAFFAAHPKPAPAGSG